MLDAALPTTYDPRRHSLDCHGVVQPKLDGVRCLIGGGGLVGPAAYSRSGGLLPGARVAVEEVGQRLDLSAWVIDGELVSGTCEQSSGAARSTGEGLTLHVFDLVRASEWHHRRTRPLSARREDLERARLSSPHVAVVPSFPVCGPAGLSWWRDRCVAEGYEGCVWKRDAAYPFGRSAAWLRCKPTRSVDCLVVGLETGTGRHEGMLRALLVELPDGTQCRVGSGFSDARRRDLPRWQAALGCMAEIRYQERSPYGGLRFAWFVRLRDDLAAPRVVMRRGHLSLVA